MRIRVVVEEGSYSTADTPAGWGRTAHYQHGTQRRVVLDAEGDDLDADALAALAHGYARPAIETFEQGGRLWCRACSSLARGGRCSNVQCPGSVRAIDR